METFYDFVSTASAPKNKEFNKFVSLCKADSGFPKTNDPAVLACYLYMKLDNKMTLAFQQALMFYHQMHPERFPQRAFARQDMALSTINLIINLQNASSEYKWH